MLANKIRICDKIGIYSVLCELFASTYEERLIALMENLNIDPTTHGILVQLPLPDYIDNDNIMWWLFENN